MRVYKSIAQSDFNTLRRMEQYQVSLLNIIPDLIEFSDYLQLKVATARTKSNNHIYLSIEECDEFRKTTFKMLLKIDGIVQLYGNETKILWDELKVFKERELERVINYKPVGR